MHLDFAELDKIYDAGRTTVYGGLTLPGGRKAVVKTIRDAFPSRRLIRGLRQEQRMLESLDAPGIVKSYGLVAQDGWLALLLEDFGGVSLATACRGRRLTLDTFLEVAIGVADALASVHEAGIIHKDVTPGNIVWNVDTGVVKLVDFGISVRASHDRAQRDVSEMEGTLAYIAPEQTGRTHRRIDWRSDLYSLGCTLYDALLGRPPFDSSDILELVHAHLAVAPRLAHEVDSSIPVALSNVLARLLEKNGEDRYQSAFGLATDLRRIRASLAKHGHCEPFELTTAAAPNRLEAPDKLYGRERELAWLQERFRSAAGDGASLCLISGYSGIGKTALVEHAEAENVAQQGTYVAGKFDQFKRGVPYASLITAFEQLVGQLVAQPAEVTQAYRERILEAVEPNGQVLIDVIPDLRLLLGDQPQVAELPAAEAENRLNVVLGRFVRALPDPGRPFVIFLDDLQWADLPSLHAIGRFVTDPHARHLLIVGAYRENEVGAAHPLRALIERVREAGRLGELQLGPLTREDTHALVHDAFGGAADADAVAAICHEKTAGNPFFLNQFLQGLYDRQLVRFDYDSGVFRADLARLREQDFTDNVVEFMSQKVGTLEGPAQRALSVASVIGNQFRLDQLGALLGDGDPGADGVAVTQAEERALTAIDAARALGLVYVESGDVVIGRFSHDRVQQAAYERLAKEERDAIHHQLGRDLAAGYHAGNDTQLFEAANHLNHVPVADLSPDERRPLAELNLRAARQARASSAYHVAHAFALAGLARQPSNGFDHDYRLTADLHLEAAESAFLTGDYAAMERELDTLLVNARDVFDEVRAYEIRVVAQNARNDLMGAMQACLDALAKLGIVLEVKPSQGAVVSNLLRTKLALRGKTVEELSALPASRGRHEQAAARLLMSLIGPAYYASPNLLPLAAFAVVRLALEKGVCAESATGFALYGLVLCTLSDFEGAYRYGQVGVAIADRFEGTRHANRARHLYNTHIRLWKEPWVRSADALEVTHERAYANGDFEYAAFSGFMRGALLGATGRDLQDVTEYMAKAAAALAEMQQNTSGLTLGIVRQAALNLRTSHADVPPYVLQGEAYDERVSVAQHREASDTTNLYCYLTTRMRLAYLFGEDAIAYAAALESAPLEAGAAATFFVPDAYFYECLTRLKVEPTLGPVDRAKSRARLMVLQRKLAKLAAAGPMNIAPRIDMIAGELARLRGNTGDALEAFDRAVRGAREQGYTDIEALALELAGRLQLERNNTLLGHTYLRASRAAYERWGALEKVHRLVEQYPFTAHGPGSEGRTATTVTTSNEHGAALDLETATRASRAISEEIVLSRLVERLMRVVVENAGAERGVLVLSSAAGPHVVAALGFVDGEPVVRHASGEPLETSAELSLGIARWVLAAGRSVVLEDAARRGDFVQDAYVRARQPRSILCAPIEYQGTLRGVIYLENNLARGAFTRDRIEMLQLLTAQAAVSIENAQLYDNLELKVAERTRQLELRNEFIRKTFGRYLSDDVVDSILDEPRGLELGGELRTVSVVMADLRGFSTAASALPPQDVLRVINHFLEGMTEVIFHYGGTIDEVLGDGLLVLFGAPVLRVDDADRAVACAIAMQSAMASVNTRNAELGLPQLEMGIGIHTGEAVVGNLGSDKRAKYGVVGTVVNLAARIEGLTTGGQVLISSETSAAVRAPLDLRTSTTFQPKGASTPLSVYEVCAIGAPFDQRVARAEHPLIDVTPFEVDYAVVTDVDAGERRKGQVVALSDADVMVVGSFCPDLLRDVCLDLPGLGADARIYGKVVAWPEPGRFVVRLTAVPSTAAAHLAERRATR